MCLTISLVMWISRMKLQVGERFWVAKKSFTKSLKYLTFSENWDLRMKLRTGERFWAAKRPLMGNWRWNCSRVLPLIWMFCFEICRYAVTAKRIAAKVLTSVLGLTFSTMTRAGTNCKCTIMNLESQQWSFRFRVYTKSWDEILQRYRSS